jgi:Z1 domain
MTSAGQEDSLQRAVGTVLASLPPEGDLLPGEVTAACDDVHRMFTRRGEVIDPVALRREVEHRVTVWQAPSPGLDDARDHVEWLPSAKAAIDWQFWNRYRRYLEDVKLMPRQVVWRLDETTDWVLGKLENPDREGAWRRYGLVVGQVQSGKTGNYIGLACKAADAGYKLIVILAGIDNSLRSQTQLRVDEGLLGFDTQYQQRYDQDQFKMGAGALRGAPRLRIASLTTSAEKGDFGRAVARNTNIPIPDHPIVLVIKKHRRILDYVRKWIVDVEGQHTPDGKKKVVLNVPVLVIDDEADNASVNGATVDPDTEPAKVNAAIRHLLESFEKSAYVGYTATPFANIYIDPVADHEIYGADLFPSHFIESLKAPSNYLGPERVFGLQSDDPDDDDIEPLPIVRPIEDYSTWIPDGHKKDWTPPAELPPSLSEAISVFVLACAARQARGQANDHKSMLIHVTRLQDVQKRVGEQIGEHLQLLKDRIRYGDINTPVEEELRLLWERDFVPTSAWFPVDQAPPVSWAQVWPEVRPAAEKIQVRVVNGNSRDALQYYDHRREGLSVIAIGGNKLSRGLTLEGLTVSYYLRASKMYDTLLQMGRWFGYRPDYEDMCRLYTTPALRDAYVEITAANDELRREFEAMTALDAKPQDFGLRVRTSPAGLEITARNKMRDGTRVKVSYSGDMPETVTFDMREATLTGNFRLLERFTTKLDAARAHERDETTGSIIWSRVPAEEIADGFLDDYLAGQAPRTKPAFIAEYIRNCQRVGELGNWTVRLVSSKTGQRKKIGPYEIGLIERARINENITAEQRYRIRRIVSPSDEAKDLIIGSDQWNRAVDATRNATKGKLDKNGKEKNEPTFPSGTPLRYERDPDQAHLLIYPLKDPRPDQTPEAPPVVGFAISFPYSSHGVQTAAEYVVNKVWQQQVLGEPDFEPDFDEGADE